MLREGEQALIVNQLGDLDVVQGIDGVLPYAELRASAPWRFRYARWSICARWSALLDVRMISSTPTISTPPSLLSLETIRPAVHDQPDGVRRGMGAGATRQRGPRVRTKLGLLRQ